MFIIGRKGYLYGKVASDATLADVASNQRKEYIKRSHYNSNPEHDLNNLTRHIK
jgi:hypothetical protein